MASENDLRPASGVESPPEPGPGRPLAEIMHDCETKGPFPFCTVSHYMRLALEIAEAGLSAREVPVGCLMVHAPTGIILAADYNHTNETSNATRHCEVECFAQIESHIRGLILSLYDTNMAQISSDGNEQDQLAEAAQASVTTAEGPSLWELLCGCRLKPREEQVEAINYKDPDVKLPDDWHPDPQQIRTVLETYVCRLQHKLVVTSIVKSTRAEQRRILDLALPSLVTQLRDQVMRDTAVVVTVEPCVMCAAAISLCNVPYVYSGCRNDRFGGCGSCVSLDVAPHLEPTESMRGSFESYVDRVVSADDLDFSSSSLSQMALKNIKATMYGFETFTSSNLAPDVDSKDALASTTVRQRFNFIWGIDAEAAVQKLRRFYLRGNPNAPENKRERDLLPGQQPQQD